MAITEPPELRPNDDLRERAIKRIKKRRDFHGHLIAYVTVNAFLVLIWAVTDVHGFFWPLFPLAGWGVGLVLNAWDVWHSEGLEEDRIQREMRRMRSGRGN